MGKRGLQRQLLEDSLEVLPELPKEVVPETFRKKCSSGRNQRSFGRTLLPEFSRNTSSGKFPEEVVLPEEFQKK